MDLQDRNPWEDLPQEIWFLVLLHLTPRELSKLSSVSQRLLLLSNENKLWLQYYDSEDWSQIFHSQEASWKDRYRENIQFEKNLTELFRRGNFDSYRLGVHKEPVLCLDFLNDSAIVTSGIDKSIKFWSLEIKQELQSLESNDTVCSVSCSKQKNHDPILLAGDGTGFITIYPNMKLLSSDRHKEFKVGIHFQAHYGFTSIVQFTEENTRFISSGQDGAIKLWDTHRAGELIQQTSFHGASKILYMKQERNTVVSSDWDSNVFISGTLSLTTLPSTSIH